MTDLIQTDPCALDPGPADLWAEARFAYQHGATAAEICARFRLGRSAFYARVAREGWRRAGLRRSAEAETEAPPPGPARPAIDLAEDAMARATHAIDHGRLAEARGWTRLAADLRQMALQDSDAKSWNEAQDAALAAYERRTATLARKAREHGLDSVDSPDSSPHESPRLSHDTARGIPLRPDSVDCPREVAESTPPRPLPPAYQRLYELTLRGPDALTPAEYAELEAGLDTLPDLEDP